MVARPFIRLFGAPALEAGSVRTPFTADRSFQLLAYLACRRQWVRRDELAEFFWPRHPAASARRNLRKVLLVAARTPGADAIERRGDLVHASGQRRMLRASP
jgi:DNA-binding SARP family transcriptional activator